MDNYIPLLADPLDEVAPGLYALGQVQEQWQSCNEFLRDRARRLQDGFINRSEFRPEVQGMKNTVYPPHK